MVGTFRSCLRVQLADLHYRQFTSNQFPRHAVMVLHGAFHGTKMPHEPQRVPPGSAGQRYLDALVVILEVRLQVRAEITAIFRGESSSDLDQLILEVSGKN